MSDPVTTRQVGFAINELFSALLEKPVLINMGTGEMMGDADILFVGLLKIRDNLVELRNRIPLDLATGEPITRGKPPQMS